MAFDRRQPVNGEDERLDFRDYLGQAYVPVDADDRYVVLDAGRQACLKAWTDRLIPGDEHWPSASEAGAPAYVDAIAARSPAIRPLLIGAIDWLERSAADRRFADLAPEHQHRLVEELARDGARGGFDLVLELSYEAYYRHPDVNRAIERRTGFRPSLPVLGSRMEPFDRGLLARVSEMPPHYRSVET